MLFLTIEWCKITFFRRILFIIMLHHWKVGYSVASGVFAGRFRGRFVKPDEAESSD